jgi:hypothetical protein
MRRAVDPLREAGAGAGEFDVRRGERYLLADLVERAAGEEHRERVRKGDHAPEGEPDGGAHHILFGDADLKESVGEGLGELVRPRRMAEVGIHHRDPRLLGPQRGQRLSVCISCSYEVSHRHSPHAAMADSSAATAFW